MFVIVSILHMFHIRFVFLFMLYLHMKLQMLILDRQLIITMKLKANYRIRLAAMLYCIIQIYDSSL